jgi:FkbM family methyltransferase
MENDGEREFESGQLLINKNVCWKELCLTMWFNENSGFWYQYLYGDKDTFRLAWKICGTNYGCFNVFPMNSGWSLNHFHNGEVIFHHRCGDKINLVSNNQNCCSDWDYVLSIIDSLIPVKKEIQMTDSVGDLTGSEWYYERVNHDIRSMSFNSDGTIGIGNNRLEKTWTLENDILTVFDDCNEPTFTATFDGKEYKGRWLRFEKMNIVVKKKNEEKINISGIFFRENCFDLEIIRSVCFNNEYQIKKEDVLDKVVIDIGAHIGSFSILSLSMGAKRVISAEASIENFEYLIKNTKLFKNVSIINAAILGNNNNKFIKFQRSLNRDNTGGGSVVYLNEKEDSFDVPVVTFDDLFLLNNSCDLLKLDCEGSEFSIIKDSKNIGFVKKIVGEYHESDLNKMKDLSDFLKGLSFEVSYQHCSENLGKFFAIKI